MDALGRMEFGPVEPGEYEVVVSVKADRHSSRPASRHPVVLVAGANRVEVPVPVLHTLTVLFPEDVAPGSSLRLRSAESRSIFFGGNKKVGKDGRVVYESLPSGEFSLTTYGGAGSGQMTILLDRDLEVRFEPEVINALRVRIDNPEGSLARAGFQSGDLVVGFDQVEFESMLQMRAAFAASMSRKSASFTVLRGDRRVEIPVEPRKLMGGGDQGGSMEPASR